MSLFFRTKILITFEIVCIEAFHLLDVSIIDNCWQLSEDTPSLLISGLTLSSCDRGCNLSLCDLSPCVISAHLSFTPYGSQRAHVKLCWHTRSVTLSLSLSLSFSGYSCFLQGMKNSLTKLNLFITMYLIKKVPSVSSARAMHCPPHTVQRAPWNTLHNVRALLVRSVASYALITRPLSTSLYFLMSILYGYHVKKAVSKICSRQSHLDSVYFGGPNT